MESSICCRSISKSALRTFTILSVCSLAWVVGATLYFLPYNSSPTDIRTTRSYPSTDRDIPSVCSAEFYDPFQEMLATRKAQYKRFWEEHPTYKIRQGKHHRFFKTKERCIKNMGRDPGAGLEDFTHRVDTREIDGFVLFHVQEYNHGKPSNGGSSFHCVVQSTDMIFMCGYQDFFNGTYLLKCPMYATCANVTLKLHYLNFRQYQGVVRAPNLQLFRGEVCLQNSSALANKPAERWLDGSNRTIWREQGVDYPISSMDFCRLVDRMVRDRFYMVGASHMEHFHRYTVLTCINHLKDLDKRLIYTPARYADDVVEAIEGLVSKNTSNPCELKTPGSKYVCGRNSTSEAVSAKRFEAVVRSLSSFHPNPPCTYNSTLQTGMLFQMGSWDLSYHGLKASLARIPILNETLKHVAHFREKNPSVQIAAISPPSHYATSYGQTRNNDIIQVFSHAVKEATESHGVPYIDIFNVMYPLHQRKAPGDGHYLFCKGSECKHDVVGLVVLQRAVAALASPCK